MKSLLPWQEDLWRSLHQRRAQQQLPHALLLTGPMGLGKAHFASLFAQALLCEQPDTQGMACDQCPACERFNAGTHPDMQRLEPEELGKAIKIDQIRGLINALSLSSHYSGYKVVIIEPADAMNISAANSLLKTLEEPTKDTLLILVSARPSQLPATIRSRCQQLRLAVPPRELAINWLTPQLEADTDANLVLDLAGGAPVAGLDLAESALLTHRHNMLSALQGLANGNEDPVQVAAAWLKLDAQMPITWLYSWVCDMIRFRQAPQNSVINSDLQDTLQLLAQQVDLSRLYGLLDRIQDAMRWLHTQANPLMLLEGLLLYWANLPRKKL